MNIFFKCTCLLFEGSIKLAQQVKLGQWGPHRQNNVVNNVVGDYHRQQGGCSHLLSNDNYEYCCLVELKSKGQTMLVRSKFLFFFHPLFVCLFDLLCFALYFALLSLLQALMLLFVCIVLLSFVCKILFCKFEAFLCCHNIDKNLSHPFFKNK